MTRQARYKYNNNNNNDDDDDDDDNHNHNDNDDNNDKIIKYKQAVTDELTGQQATSFYMFP